jgi:hypothetical protein
MITASVVSQPITASVSGTGSISASVGSSVVSASVGNGIGPQGPPGNAGAGLSDLTDVSVNSVQNGDVLQYNSAKWRNVNQNQVTDGGNF